MEKDMEMDMDDFLDIRHVTIDEVINGSEYLRKNGIYISEYYEIRGSPKIGDLIITLKDDPNDSQLIPREFYY